MDDYGNDCESLREQLATMRQRAEAAEAALAAVPVEDVPCEWREDAGGVWYTSCRDAWEVNEGTPAASGYKYCPCCGKVIDAHAYVEPEAEDEEAQP